MDLSEDVPDIVIINYMMLPGQIEQYIQQRRNAAPDKKTVNLNVRREYNHVSS